MIWNDLTASDTEAVYHITGVKVTRVKDRNLCHSLYSYQIVSINKGWGVGDILRKIATIAT